ncbi:hypothetical protein CHARACLAT_031432 [Characodon lateralis]|uniref:Uncharacterized protein n=1 Tax=Characodon lateralis TaxID=208331 RepID=A0ABU7EP61_9TELE|nr:hypothetical protein [Characodon lateralis]
MRYVVLHGCLWDDLYIGFQNRISRDPDIYHHRFWNHFQTQLPLRCPDWNQFLVGYTLDRLPVHRRATQRHRTNNQSQPNSMQKDPPDPEPSWCKATVLIEKETRNVLLFFSFFFFFFLFFLFF